MGVIWLSTLTFIQNTMNSVSPAFQPRQKATIINSKPASTFLVKATYKHLFNRDACNFIERLQRAYYRRPHALTSSESLCVRMFITAVSTILSVNTPLNVHTHRPPKLKQKPLAWKPAPGQAPPLAPVGLIESCSTHRQSRTSRSVCPRPGLIVHRSWSCRLHSRRSELKIAFPVVIERYFSDRRECLPKKIEVKICPSDFHRDMYGNSSAELQ